MRDLDKLNLIWWFDLNLEPIFASALVGLVNTTNFKSDPMHKSSSQ